jgi:uncharacterized membrane protein
MLFVILYLFEGLLLMLVSGPMIRRRVAPNRFYGFRTPKTLSSPDIWYPANEFSGRRLFAAGAVIATCSLILAPVNLLGDIGSRLYTFAMIGIMLLSLCGAVVASFRYLKRL